MLVYLGWDPREVEAYRVAAASIHQHASSPVEVLPLKLDAPPVSTYMQRPIAYRDGKLWCPISEAPMSTEFAISRFVIPFAHTRGFVLFADCDIVCLSDIVDLFDLADPQYAVQVVKHNYIPAETTKMDGQQQTQYNRKNWSSVVLWNCDHPAHHRLTLKDLNTWPGRRLHAFEWLTDDEIGELPPEWNVLVGVESYAQPKLLHFTLGGPWIPQWEGGTCDDIWRTYQQGVIHGG